MLKFCKFYIENESKFHYQVVGTEEDEEAMEQLVLNAQNLMQSVKVPYIYIINTYCIMMFTIIKRELLGHCPRSRSSYDQN